ncbi:MAG: bacillithiol system redox-active protein YtxJ [Bacteroidota bacterium]
MEWKVLNAIDQIESIKKESEEKQVLIFKHSTRCSISAMALDRLQRSWDTDEMVGIEPYYLDLIRFRNISNALEGEFNVMHQSPQVLLIKNGECIYDDSHFGIDYGDIKDQVLVKN